VRLVRIASLLRSGRRTHCDEGECVERQREEEEADHGKECPDRDIGERRTADASAETAHGDERIEEAACTDEAEVDGRIRRSDDP